MLDREALEQVLNCNAHICVVGDIILDRYTWGNATRVSPEAPVTILDVDSEEVRLGGAAAVAMLLAHMGASVELAGVLGDDPEGRIAQKLLDEANVGREAVIIDPSRPTTHKQRLIGRAMARHPQQIIRVDRETREPLSPEVLRQLCRNSGACARKAEVTAIADYGKGACHEEVMRLHCRSGLAVLVDPASGANYQRYRGASLIKPNRREAEETAGRMVSTCEEALAVATQLRQASGAAIVITLDQDGLVFADESGTSHVPTCAREVYDVTGAGDTALAMLALGKAAQLSLVEACELVNLAAGIQIARLGVSPVTPDDLLKGWRQGTVSKVVSAETASQNCNRWRQDQQRVVFTNGCFDLLHAGHVGMLHEAASLGDRLVVAINSDRSVRALKGADRPVIEQSARAKMLAALECVDQVVVFDDATPERLLRELRPDVLVKGGTTGEIVGRDIVESYGGSVLRTTAIEGVSTTALLEAARGGGQ